MILDLAKRSVSLLVAREVEWCAAMVRQFGYAFPHEYNVAVALDLELDGMLWVRIRIDHAVLDARVDIARADDGAYDWRLHLARIAQGTVHEWLEQHPSNRPSKAWMRQFLAHPRDDAALLARVSETCSKATFSLR